MISKTNKIITWGTVATAVILGIGTLVSASNFDINKNLFKSSAGSATAYSLQFTRANSTYKKNASYSYSFTKQTSSGTSISLISKNWYELSSASYSNYIGAFYKEDSSCYLTLALNDTGSNPCRFQALTSVKAILTGSATFKVYKESVDGVTFTDASPLTVTWNYLDSSPTLSLPSVHYIKIVPTAECYMTRITFGYTCGDEEEKTLDSIAVKTAPTNTSYTEGDNFNPAGLVITATYSDASTSDIAYSGNESDFSFTPSLSAALTTSDESVTISYGGKSTTQAITVEAAESGLSEVYSLYVALSESYVTIDFDNNIYSYSIYSLDFTVSVSGSSFTLTFVRYRGNYDETSFGNYRLFNGTPVANVTTNATGVIKTSSVTFKTYNGFGTAYSRELYL